MLYTSGCKKNKTEDLVYFVYWINKINKHWNIWLTDGVGGGGVYSVTSGCFDLVRPKLLGWPAIQMASSWPIYIFPTSNSCSRKYYLWKKNDWLKNRLFFKLRIFWGFWIDYAWSLCIEAMIFSLWHWPLLGQHPVAVIFFYSVNVCGSVFCVF